MTHWEISEDAARELEAELERRQRDQVLEPGHVPGEAAQTQEGPLAEPLSQENSNG